MAKRSILSLAVIMLALAAALSLWQDGFVETTERLMSETTKTAPAGGNAAETPAGREAGRTASEPEVKARVLGHGPMIDARDDTGRTNTITRTAFLQGALAVGATVILPRGLNAATSEGKMLTRKIPSSGEELPVVGLGTWQVFDVGEANAERAPLGDVLKALYAAGGSVVDSSPMYGKSEGVAGDLIQSLGARGKTFIATKVWTSGKAEGVAQMQRSMKLFKTEKIDLMQVHNLLDYKTHLDTLRGWKQEGRVRYIGVTHYTPSAFAQLEAVLRSEKLDFVQLDYAVDDRAAEKTLLPLAQEKGIAVLVNRPFGGGGLMRRLKGKALPDFAGEVGATSWAQLLLKFILAHPAVTCAIPGTAKAEHMADNVRGGMGVLPDAALREKIAAAVG